MKIAEYQSYKQTQSALLGEIPHHWPIVKFKKILQERNERSETGLETLLSVSAYTGVSKREDTIETGEHLTRAESLEGYKRCFKNDLVINIMLAWNRGLAVTEIDGIVSPAYSVFKIVSDEVQPKFLNYLVRTDQFNLYFKAFSTGVIDSRLRLYPDTFGRLSCWIPPRNEQLAIVSFLDAETSKIDALVAEQRRLIELLKEKRQAVISHAVTKGLNPHVKMKPSGIDWLGEVPEHWEIARLGRCGILQNGLSIDGEAFGSGFPFISYSDVYQNEILPELPRGLVRTTEKDQERYDVAVGDVFFTRTSETVDDIGIASTCLASIPRATFAGFLIRFRPTANTLWPNYSTYLFRNEGVKRHFAGTMNLVTRASLSQGVLKALPICIPPRDEQRDIARYLDDRAKALLHLISQAEKAIALLQERRTALISAAVTGKIDVRGFSMKEDSNAALCT